MYFKPWDKYKIRHRALLEAIRFCGGVSAYSNRIKVSRSRASNWCNKPEINIPYEYVVLTEDVTRVSIERLSPFTELANKTIRRFRSVEKLLPVEMAINKIIIDNYQNYQNYKQEERPIIVGTDRVLISGLNQVNVLKAKKMQGMVVTIVDLESLLLGMKTISDLICNLLISEQIAIGLRLEKLMNDVQDKGRNNIRYCQLGNTNQLRPRWDEVKTNYERIAHIVGMNNKSDYFQARQVYLSGDSELMNKLDSKEIALSAAVGCFKLRNQVSG